jgi:hypothetical protein
MTDTTKTPTRQPRPLALEAVQFPAGSTARRIARSPYLVGLLDSDELTKLRVEYSNAHRIAAKAALLARQAGGDLDAEITEAVRNGADAEDLMARIVEARTTRDQRSEAAKMLDVIASRILSELARFLDGAAEDLLDVLAEKLDEILDRGADAVAALDGARTAEEAIEKDLAAEWATLRAVHREYIALREGHTTLARALDQTSYRDGHDAFAWAFWTRPELIWPQLPAVSLSDAHVRTGRLDVYGVEASPVDLINPRDLGHFLSAVTRRDEVGPRVAHPDDAKEARGAAIQAYRQGRPAEAGSVSGPLTDWHGSEAAVVGHYLGGGSMPKQGQVIFRSRSELS